MALVFSHISALEYLRLSRVENHKYTAVSRARWIISSPPQEDFIFLEQISRPFHILVGEKISPRHSAQMISHTWSLALPKGYILDTHRGFYVVSPELCFVQMAWQVSFVELVKIGYELCGTYHISEGVIHPCAPLTTIKKLRDFIDNAHYVRGTRIAERALRLIAENSASPMETALTMLLCLPYKYGGYGIRQPLLNSQIDTGKVSSSYYLVCDLYWPDIKLAVEYDSDMFHVGADRITKDSIRRSELNTLGIGVVSVMRGQIVSRREMDKIACLLAKLTSKKLRYKEPAFSEANRKLRSILFG